jgi:hypothetical protein
MDANVARLDREEKECHDTVKQFMETAAAKDIDSLCNLVQKRNTSRRALERLVLGNYQRFEGYQDVKWRRIIIETGESYMIPPYIWVS